MNLQLDLVTALGPAVTEIVSNAYLHAFSERGGTIRLHLTRGDAGGRLTISDDGVGFVAPVEGKRHGLGLIRRLIEQEEGTAELVSLPSTTWKLLFPIPHDRFRPAVDESGVELRTPGSRRLDRRGLATEKVVQ